MSERPCDYRLKTVMMDLVVLTVRMNCTLGILAPGMGEEVSPAVHLFQRFNQNTLAETWGLYFNQQHLSLLVGDVKITSEVNIGTKVKIELPVG